MILYLLFYSFIVFVSFLATGAKYPLCSDLVAHIYLTGKNVQILNGVK